MKYRGLIVTFQLALLVMLSALPAWGASSPFRDGLEIYLPLDGTIASSGNRVFDPTILPSGRRATFVQDGRLGSAARFKNLPVPGLPTDWAINLGRIDSLYSGDFTVALWVRTTSTADSGLTGNKDWSLADNTGWLITTLHPRFFTTRFTSGPRVDVGTDIRDGNWHHCAVTVSRGDATVSGYVDGALVERGSFAALPRGSLASGLTTLIGGTGAGAYSGSGDVDDYALWTRALSDDEIEEIYFNALSSIPVGKIGIVPTTLSVDPLSITNFAGLSAQFELHLPGTRFSFQWVHDGQPVVGATNRILQLTNLSLADAGNYQIQVTGYNGTFSSDPVQLSVTPLQDCSKLHENLEVYLNLDGNVVGSGGTIHDGLILPVGVGVPRFVKGMVGSAARFENNPASPTPSDWAISLGGLSPLFNSSSFTLSFWLRLEGAGEGAVLGNKSWESGNNTGWAFNQTYERFLNVRAENSARRDIGQEIRDSRWHQITWIVDRSRLGGSQSLYVDAFPVATDLPIGPTGLEPLSPSQAYDTLLGASGPGAYAGSAEIDEFAIWPRALTGEDAACLYVTGLLGQPIAVPDVLATVIREQPQSLERIEGFPASLRVTASGGNLRYRWSFNGAPLQDATNALLVITPVNLADAGRYRVTVTGDGGSVISQEALLTVIPAPRSEPRKDLLVHLDFDGSLSSPLTPSRSGTAVGGSPRFTSGKLGLAASFQNNLKAGPPSDWVVSLGNLNPWFDSAAFTVAFWMKTDTSGDGAITGNKDWTSGNNVGWLVNQTYPALVNVRAANGPRIDAGSELRDGTWHHVALVTDRTGGRNLLTVFIDGSRANDTITLGGSGSASLSPDENYDTLIGGSGPGSFSGRADVDDYGIWSRALSSEDVASLFSYGQRGTPLAEVPSISMVATLEGNNFKVSWDPSLKGYRLETSDVLRSGDWNSVALEGKSEFVVPLQARQLYVRLRWVPPVGF